MVGRAQEQGQGGTDAQRPLKKGRGTAGRCGKKRWGQSLADKTRLCPAGWGFRGDYEGHTDSRLTAAETRGFCPKSAGVQQARGV